MFSSPSDGRHGSEPRASRLPLPEGIEPRFELWMGGAHALAGELVHPEDLREAWVIDCAAELPEEHRAAAALWLPRVFLDIEEQPHGWTRLAQLGRTIAECVRGNAGARDGWEHPHEPPARLYVVCSQGLNRSGLVAGLVLRGLGMPGEQAVVLIQRHRAGALNNLTFARLVREAE